MSKYVTSSLTACSYNGVYEECLCARIVGVDQFGSLTSGLPIKMHLRISVYPNSGQETSIMLDLLHVCILVEPGMLIN